MEPKDVVFTFWQVPGPIVNENFLPQYLSCLTTSRSLTDKLAFDVGLQEDSTGRAKLLYKTHIDCWL